MSVMSESLQERVVAAVGTQYEIDGEIGRGGMSVVYRARDRRLNRPVAIKVLPPELAHDPAIRTRFTREAQMSGCWERCQNNDVVPALPIPARRRFGSLSAVARVRTPVRMGERSADASLPSIIATTSLSVDGRLTVDERIAQSIRRFEQRSHPRPT